MTAKTNNTVSKCNVLPRIMKILRFVEGQDKLQKELQRFYDFIPAIIILPEIS